MSTYSTLLIIHIIVAFSALICGFLATVLKRRLKQHRLVGNIYYYSMIGVFLTVIPMYMIKGNAILFFLLIGIFSTYLTLAGKRYLSLNNRPKNIRWYDNVVIVIALLTGLLMQGYGGYILFTSGRGFGIILLVFGSVLFLNSLQDLLFLGKVKRAVKNLKRPVLNHVPRMGGAYIATFTAFTVNNFNGLLPWYISWFAPTVIGTAFIIMTTRGIRQRHKNRIKNTSVISGVEVA